jgi:hypothetical protein
MFMPRQKEVASMRINIMAGSLTWPAVINDTGTGHLIYKALPIRGRASRWGKEIYFAVPVDAKTEPGANDVVSMGDLGYWPAGKAFCIFFGRTPASAGDEIRAASAVNIFGRVESGFEKLEQVEEGAEIIVDKS